MNSSRSVSVSNLGVPSGLAMFKKTSDNHSSERKSQSGGYTVKIEEDHMVSVVPLELISDEIDHEMMRNDTNNIQTNMD